MSRRTITLSEPLARVVATLSNFVGNQYHHHLPRPGGNQFQPPILSGRDTVNFIVQKTKIGR